MSTSTVFSGFDIMMIRFGLLVSDFTFSAGDLHFGIMMGEYNAEKDRNTKSKLDYISHHIGDNKFDIVLPQRVFDSINFNYKTLKKVKYKNSFQRKHLKDIETWATQHCENINAQYANIYARAGMTQLKMFYRKELEFNPVDPKATEFVKEGDESYFSMSHVLFDRFSIETPDDIYLVTGDFSDYIKENKLVVSPFGGTYNADTKLLRAEKTLSFPHILLLTGNEIGLVREHLFSTNQQWRANIDKWFTELLPLPFSSNNFETISKRFISDIEPQSKLLQIEINKNDRLSLLKMSSHKDYQLNINLYVTNIGTYWDYLFSINTIGEETMEVLKKHPDYETLKHNCCIILEGCSENNEGTDPAKYKTKVESVQEEINNLTKRKTLDI